MDNEQLKPRLPNVRVEGPFATHDQACAVFAKESAVLDLASGTFHPSWKAQEQGYRLVAANTWYRRWALRSFFGVSI